MAAHQRRPPPLPGLRTRLGVSKMPLLARSLSGAGRRLQRRPPPPGRVRRPILKGPKRKSGVPLLGPVSRRPPRPRHPTSVLTIPDTGRRPSQNGATFPRAGRPRPGVCLPGLWRTQLPLLSREAVAAPIGRPRLSVGARRASSVKGTSVAGPHTHGQAG